MTIIIILKNFETGEVKNKMSMTHREKDERNAILDITLYVGRGERE